MKYNGFYFWMFKSPMKKVLAEKYGREYAADIMKKSKKVYRELVEKAEESQKLSREKNRGPRKTQKKARKKRKVKRQSSNTASTRGTIKQDIEVKSSTCYRL